MPYAPVTLPPDFIERAKSVWAEYQRVHDVSSQHGRVAAVDPESKRVWIGDEAVEAVNKMNADGIDTPVYLVRVGFDYLDVKGRR